MGRVKKVVLAYSGGVDTSVCIPYLKQEWGVEEVITLAADLGQGDELEPNPQKSPSCWSCPILDCRCHPEFHL